MSAWSLGDFDFHIGANTDDFQKKMGGVISSLRGGFQNLLKSVVAPVMAAMSAKAFIQDMTADLSKLNEMSKNLGVSVESISTWENAFVEAGASIDKVGELFTTLNNNMQTAAVKGTGAIQRLVDKGLIPSYTDLAGGLKNVEDYAVELSDALASMDSSQAAGVMKQLGFSDADTIDFMRQGSAAIREQLVAAQGLGVTTADDVKKAKDFEASLGRLSHAIKRLLLPVFSAIVPLFSAAASMMTLITQHSTVLIPVIAGLAVIITKTFLPALIKMGAALMMNPLTWIIAGLTVLGLLLEDFVVWLNGGKSAFGDFYESVFGDAQSLKQEFNDFVDSLKKDAPAVKAAAATIGVGIIAALTGPVGLAVAVVAGLAWVIYDNWDEITAACGERWSDFCADMGNLWDGVKTRLKNAWDTVAGVWNKTIGAFSSAWDSLCANAGALWDGTMAKLKSSWDAATGVWDKIIGALGSAWDSFCAGAGTLWDGAKSKLKNSWDSLAGIWDKTTGALGSAWDSYCANAGTLWDGVKTQLQNSWNALPGVWDTTTGALGSAWDTFTSAIGEAPSYLGGKWKEFTDAVLSAWDSCVGTLRSVWDGFKSLLTDGIEWLLNKVTGIVDKVAGAWKSVKSFFGFGGDDEKTPSAQGQKSQEAANQAIRNMSPELAVAFPNGLPDELVEAMNRDKAAASAAVPPSQVVSVSSQPRTQNNEMQTTVIINGTASPADYNRARETANSINAGMVDAVDGSQFGPE